MKSIRNILLGITIFFPTLTFAQVDNLFDAENLLYDLLIRFQYFLWALAIAAFFWGLVKFIKNAGDTKEHEEGKQFIVWALISFLVLVSIWALVSFVLVDTLDIGGTDLCYVDKYYNQVCP